MNRYLQTWALLLVVFESLVCDAGAIDYVDAIPFGAGTSRDAPCAGTRSDPSPCHELRPRESLKRWWKTEMWEIFFEVLLNFPTLDFKSPPPLGDLRRMFEEHIMEERAGA